jgi:hypothetical protein
MLLSRHQNAGQIHDIHMVSRSFQNVALFLYLGTTEKDQNRFRRNLRGDSIRVVLDTIQSFRLLSKIETIRMYKNIILPVVLYGSET